MHKKVLGLITLLCLALPLVVFASSNWQMKTQVMSAGGSITMVPTGEVNTYGMAFKTYTTTGTTQYAATVTPEAGYKIASVIFDGAPQFPSNSSLAFTIAAFAPTAASQHSLIVNFTKVLYTVAMNTADGGYVSPAGSLKYKPGSNVTYTLTPASGKNLVSVSGTSGSTVTYYNASTGAVVTLPAATDVAVLMSVSNIQAGATFTPSFKGVTASAGAPQTAVVGTTVTLAAGTASSYSWLQLGGPEIVTLSSTSAQKPTFTPGTAGVYTFKVTVTSGAYSDSATTTVTASSSLTQASYVTCIKCHSQVGVGAGIYANWSTSVHSGSAHSSCQACHVGTNTGAHPGTVSTSTVDSVNFTTKVANVNGTLAQGAVFCTFCHTGSYPIPHATVGLPVTCSSCHTASNGDAHSITDIDAVYAKVSGCVDCHAVANPAKAGGVNDNNGVRAIMPEFTKRSHHITGGTPTNAQCVVCHLEGKASGTAILIDKTYHMADANVHLRNADDNSDMAWDGTNHTTMDNFCFSCHDSDGATGLAASGLQGVTGFTGTSTNPFGDTLTNGYDQVARTGVVDVKTAFTTTNASHHAVSGQRYKYRFSTTANAAAWAARTGNPVPAASEVAEGHTDLDGNPISWTGLTYDPAGPEEGGEATLYEGGKFVATYIPLGDTKNVADNSTLHCGDCHTVGQWKVGSSTNADGTTTSVAIGAHGSVNEYLLRNSLGTDEIHNNLTYVCFNCHKAGEEEATQTLWDELVAEGKITGSAAVTGTYLNCADFGGYTDTNKTACVGGAGVTVSVNKPATAVPTWKAGWNALHPTVVMGQLTGYYVAHAVSAMHGQCQADSANAVGATRLVASWEPDKVGIYDYVPAAGATATSPSAGSTEPFVAGSNANSGNITGIACINCHNSGLRNSWGGIHGGNNTYTDGLGRTQTTYRFMPGMGNYRYAPPGGWDGQDISDNTLLTVNNPIADNGPAYGSGSAGFPGASGKPMGGCYTNGAADTNPGYSTCSHHGTSSAAQSNYNAAGTVTQSGVTAYFRTTYGGGTTGNPTTYEPTVREATSGSSLVTRPLKY